MSGNSSYPSRIGEQILAEVRRAVARGEASTMEELQATLARAVAAHNVRPREELGGLSPEQSVRLLHGEWEGSGAVVGFDTALPSSDLAGSRTLENARIFLSALRDAGGTRATSAGNLNRRFVEQMVEAMRWPPGYVEDLRRWNKVVNERDARLLHLLRVLLQEAALLQRRKGAFRATRKAEALRAPERAGELLALLVRTQFRKLNLAYLDGLPAAPAFQEKIVLPLRAFRALDLEWRDAEHLAPLLLPPRLREELPPAWGGRDSGPLLLETRLLRPLEGFGLAEIREEAGAHPLLPHRFYRPTALCRRFMSFAV